MNNFILLFNFKKAFMIIPSLLLISIIIGCTRNEENNDEYYIKYEVNSATIYSNGKLKVGYLNENNQTISLEIPTKSKWEINVGPVKKGYKASMTVNELTENYNRLSLNAQISSSKNNSPFAIKKQDNDNTPRKSLIIEYTVDY